MENLFNTGDGDIAVVPVKRARAAKTHLLETAPSKRRAGKADMNFMEWPLGLAADRPVEGINELEFSDEIRHKRTGQKIQRTWNVKSNGYGLPTRFDVLVYIALVKLTLDAGFKEPKVWFSRYELAKLLRLPLNQQTYDRLEEALNRMGSTWYTSKNAFYNKLTESYVSNGFNLWVYTLDREPSGRYPAQKERHSNIVWSDIVWNSMTETDNPYIKTIDIDLLLGLSSGLTQQLCLYLEKNRQFTGVPMDLIKIAHEKLAISRDRKAPSAIRRSLDRAHRELVECRFIKDFNFLPSRGSGELRVKYDLWSVKDAQRIYETGELFDPEFESTDVIPDDVDPKPAARAARSRIPARVVTVQDPEEGTICHELLTWMISTVGVNRSDAAEFVDDASLRAEVVRQRTYWEYREIKSNPGGLFAKAVRNGFGPPLGYTKAQEAETARLESDRRRAARAAAGDKPGTPTPGKSEGDVKPKIKALVLASEWDKVLEILPTEFGVNEATMRTHILSIAPVCVFEDGQIQIACPTQFTFEWLDKKYTKVMSNAFSQVLDRPVMVRFTLRKTEHKTD